MNDHGKINLTDSAVSSGGPVVEVTDLAIAYDTRKSEVQAVRDVSFAIQRGEALGLVGESGCGKSTLAYGLIGYLGRNGRINHGDVLFQGESMVQCSEKELRRLRGNNISMVFQDPMSALNPVLRIGEQMTEVLTTHQEISSEEAYEKCLEMLERVYMPDRERIMQSYPHQISGGQQQRVVIGMALLNNPALLIMDEPTTSLDVTVEAAVLDLVADLRHEFDAAILFITHNLGVISRVCDRVGVMYAGELVELASVKDIMKKPRHPYTRGLIRCLPRLGASKTSSTLYPIEGRVPKPDECPEGCIFSPRCVHAQANCQTDHPDLRFLDSEHQVRCFYAEELVSFGWQQDTAYQVPEAHDQVEETPILSVDDVEVHYPHSGASFLSSIGLAKKQYVRAVDGVKFDVPRGKTLGIVGESGCGKSSLVKALIGLEEITGGEACFQSFELKGRANKRDIALIRELQMVFQNPDSTLNPRYSVGRQIARPLKRFKIVPKNQQRQEVIRLLAEVNLGAHYYDRLPRQLSGGEKQRVGIARAFAGRPDLVLCDEPVSALDVSVQAAVLNLLLEIQKQNETTILFIAHDLSVVRFLSDYIAVMYLGKIVEYGPAEAIYAPPNHPYTESLLASIPIPDPEVDQKCLRLEGNVPSPLNPPSGCNFHTRCPRRDMLPEGGVICEQVDPPDIETSGGHRIACHIPLKELSKLEAVIHPTGDGKSTPC